MNKTLSLLLLMLVANYSFAQWTTNGSSTFLTNASGRVGLGTSTPAFQMHIKSADQYPRFLIQSTHANGNPGYSIGKSSTEHVWTMHYDIAGEFLGFYREGLGNALTMNSLGNVGIGTSTPKTLLDLKHLRLGPISSFPAEGSVLEGVWGNYIIGEVDGLQRLRLGVSNDLYTRAEIFLDNSNSYYGTISFKTSAGPGGAITRMFINAAGAVGIGTTSPGSFKLAVDGKIGARELRVLLTNPWPDFVFDKEYNLPTLRFVEDFVKKNRHLPGIQSASQVAAEKGFDVGDLNLKLLQKVEELTLHLIEHEKKINELTLLLKKSNKDVSD